MQKLEKNVAVHHVKDRLENRMNKCNGWDKLSHDTTRPLTKIITLSCNFCGGFDCGDFSEVLFLCPKCLEDYEKEE